MFKKAYLCVMVVIFPLLPSFLFAQAPDTLWTRRYNGPDNDYDNARSCVVDNSGNLYVTGSSSNTYAGEFLTIKYNSAGDTLWTRSYSQNILYDCSAQACAVDDSGNLYVTGSSYNGMSDDCLTVKYNSAGDTLWSRRYSGLSYSCVVDGSGNIYVTGISLGNDFLTIKYNPAGDTIWTRSYDGPAHGYDCANGCVVDISGNLYVVGTCDNGLYLDYLTVKYNAAGDTIWVRAYNGPADNFDQAYGCVVDDLGNVYVTGLSSNGTSKDYLTIKYNAAGDTLWTRRYNNPIANGAPIASCAVDGSGNLYITGNSYNGTNWDFLTIKYNVAGDTLWSCRYNGPANGNDAAYSCEIDGSGNLYVTGYSYNGTNDDYLTIKYNTATGVAGKPKLPMTVSKLKLEQNRPNPFSQHTTISYQLPTTGPASLNIYNAAGQLVKTFDMGQQQAGYHQVEWSGSNIPAGVYFYRLTAGNHQATKKLVVVK